MKGADPLGWLDNELAALEAGHLRRRLITHTGPQGAAIAVAGRQLLNFGSNDYLALAADPRVIAAAQRALTAEGWGAGASPLLAGHTESHQRLEQKLAAFEGAAAALVFPSGFAANVGTIAALASAGDVIYSDELNHASLVDGCRLSRAQVVVYPHRDWQWLAAQLQNSHPYRRRLIVTDSLFSMEGDLAPLAELADLAERYDAMLMVDEAHASGLFGAGGRGVAEELGVLDRVHVRMGTLSKAIGASGGFVAGSQALVDWLVNKARPYIFSTAGPAANCAAALRALEIIEQEPQRRAALLNRASDFRRRLRDQGWNLGASQSQIVPLVVGDSATALHLATRLREQGIWAPAIRPPAVPAGRALLRISLSWGHTGDMLEQLIAALARVSSTANKIGSNWPRTSSE